MRNDKQVMQDVSLTFRLPAELDQVMRESAKFFGRSAGAEWRTAAQLYHRVLTMWARQAVPPESSACKGRDARARQTLLFELCDGLVRPPQSIEELRAALEADPQTDGE